MFGLLRSGLSRIGKALAKTRSILGDKVRKVFSKPLDDETLDQLEQILFEADLGSGLTLECVDHIRTFANKHPHAKGEEFLKAIKAYAHTLLEKPPTTQGKKSSPGFPKVILLVGVNGSGKTTSAAKLAHIYLKEKKSVLLAAGDTFRAAATEQLGQWADRLHIDCVKGKKGGDPSAVIFDALSAAKARGIEVVIADTAGRLESKTALMHELAKIKKTSEKVIPNAPHEIFLVLDATTGQNGVDQVKTFHAFTPLTGIILTKIDGSAKGGILLSIYHQMGIPTCYLGIGEKVHDLICFDANHYLDALFNS